MTEFRTIEIDFDVHKRIEAERLSFAETANEVLRRMLSLDQAETTFSPASTEGRAWAGKGVMLPHGTELRMEYNGSVHTGRIENGGWVVEGKNYSSPSAAASGVGRTKAGKRTNLDGWVYWHVKRPDDDQWTAIMSLRRAA